MEKQPESSDPDPGFPQGFAMLEGEKVIEKNENSVTLGFSIPGDNPYFDGHFPCFPILPAVAQMELVVRFASRYLGTGGYVSEMPRIKYTNIIRPSAQLVLKLEKKEKAVSFRMASPNGETIYSMGTLEMRESCCPKDSL